MSQSAKEAGPRSKQEAAVRARSVRRRVGYLLIAFLIGSQFASVYTSYLAMQAPKQGAQLRSFELALSESYGWLCTAESAQRGHIFAGLKQSEVEIDDALRQARSEMGRAWELGKGVPSLRGRMQEIQAAFVAKVDWIDQVRQAERQQGLPAAAKLVRTGHGRQLMDAVRQSIQSTKGLEAVLVQRDTDLARFYGHVDVWSGVVVIGIGVILAVSLYLLSERVGRTEGELSALQRERTVALEREVAKRTAQLQLANGDLEAFSSLTARGVLREVDEIGKSLKGRDDLSSVQEHVHELRQTLNSVLLLGKLSREAGPSESVDLSEAFRKVIADREPIPGLTVQIAEGVFADANEKGVRILFQALVNSAWPALLMAESPSIEFSAHQGTFVFRHSGTGTLPTEVWDLLPSSPTDEVRQVDIAVAIAQRVVWRHGGRIWADSVPGRRTSIHFTLAPERTS